jgi:hypothetical protein
MNDTPQKRAIKNYRHRLTERGMARFEVLALEADRDLIRSLAKRLAEDGPEANRIRSIVSRSVEGTPPLKGGILEALRRSPLVGADLDLTRLHETGRNIIKPALRNR